MVQVVPSGLDCHWKVAAGFASGLIDRVAPLPAVTFWSAGWVAMASHCTFRIPALLTASGLAVLAAVARNRAWWSVLATVKEYVAPVAPVMGAQVVPPSLLRCQVKEGVGLPLATTVKLATLPALMVWLAG